MADPYFQLCISFTEIGVTSFQLPCLSCAVRVLKMGQDFITARVWPGKRRGGSHTAIILTTKLSPWGTSACLEILLPFMEHEGSFTCTQEVRRWKRI
jgi:hypothetical protein